ncbi:hypothetical protein BJ508DRAFT_111387 [Ascobolus immersus RN42]|uniref:Fungal N-terminal domain-containing protein n=1 Tax=Ascobolus immersus RN42 TaxID=1160509 RepID=A0A3N4IBN8_ASCIM|nr:hypothetical protein BJ508DRAFT_111387 [Ascobolus immersus RN42]
MSSTLLSMLPSGSTIATGLHLFRIFEEMRTAPFDIRAIEQEIHELCPILQQLHDRSIELGASNTLDQASGALWKESEKNLKLVLLNCDAILRETVTLLSRYNSGGKARFFPVVMDRLSWVMDGQGKAGRLKKRLDSEASKVTLNIAVGLMIQQRIETAGETVDLIHDDTQLMKSQIETLLEKLVAGGTDNNIEGTRAIKAQICVLLAKLHDELGESTLDPNNSESKHSLMLSRFLASTSTYAESTVLGDELDVEIEELSSRPEAPKERKPYATSEWNEHQFQQTCVDDEVLNRQVQQLLSIFKDSDTETERARFSADLPYPRIRLMEAAYSKPS